MPASEGSLAWQESQPRTNAPGIWIVYSILCSRSRSDLLECRLEETAGTWRFQGLFGGRSLSVDVSSFQPLGNVNPGDFPWTNPSEFSQGRIVRPGRMRGEGCCQHVVGRVPR